MAETEYNYGDLPDKWTWWNCRSLVIGVSWVFCPWDWYVKASPGTNNHSGEWRGWVQFGPLVVSLDAAIGNISSESRWRAWFGITEDEAYQRSANIQARAARKALRNG